ncbi:hypothetical protein EJ04DRAFT_51610 [Polyplosphaeria fusca]|uniref:Uncharacterized protein n=1 Tax=Polyplosphaeria fusca TaxID=682080 RepID=A0A9P4R8H0_9PLEO|nr:hypothetical protein EJ04DRAFT_51610 [Polyplosphaeria fusca]
MSQNDWAEQLLSWAEQEPDYDDNNTDDNEADDNETDDSDSTLSPIETPCPNKRHQSKTRGVEYSPRNRWTKKQHTLLLVIYKFFESADKNVHAKVYKALTGLDLKTDTIRHRFDHLVLSGGKAYPEFKRVMSDTPINDPLGSFSKMRNRIEKRAYSLNIELRYRDKELSLTPGKAAHAKCFRTRALYHHLVQKAQTSLNQETEQTDTRSFLRDETMEWPIIPGHSTILSQIYARQ